MLPGEYFFPQVENLNSAIFKPTVPGANVTFSIYPSTGEAFHCLSCINVSIYGVTFGGPVIFDACQFIVLKNLTINLSTNN